MNNFKIDINQNQGQKRTIWETGILGRTANFEFRQKRRIEIKSKNVEKKKDAEGTKPRSGTNCPEY